MEMREPTETNWMLPISKAQASCHLRFPLSVIREHGRNANNRVRFLSGTGLQSQPQPRYVPICSELSLGFSSPLKFQWKIFNGGRSKGDDGRGKTGATRANRKDLAGTGIEEVVFALEAIKANSGAVVCNDFLLQNVSFVGILYNLHFPTSDNAM